MWQEIIVGLVVAVAAWFVGRRLWRTFRRAADPSAGPACGCGDDSGCAGCSGGPAPQQDLPSACPSCRPTKDA